MIAGLLAAAALISEPAFDLAELAWMSGGWMQVRPGGAIVQETWLRPLGGVMAGVSQTTRPGGKPFVEHMIIRVEPDGVTFTAMLPGQTPTAFVMAPGKDGEAVFENQTHDFPQRIVYRRCGKDLCAAIEGVQDGRPRREEWRYKRVR